MFDHVFFPVAFGLFPNSFVISTRSAIPDQPPVVSPRRRGSAFDHNGTRKIAKQEAANSWS
jgi:hypothetical protein